MSYLHVLVLCLSIGVVHGQYQWACTQPDDNGQWYIPSERDKDVTAGPTENNLIHIYPVGNLTESCSGEVTAIEFCYRYTVSGGGEPYFNWTVLILGGDGSSFVVNNIFTIESRPAMLSNGNCTNDGTTRSCCDVQQITFTLPKNFTFAFTESTHGNTHGAELLGFHESLPQYSVNVRLLNRDTFITSLSVGSTLPRTPSAQRAIRMIWFVIESQTTTFTTIGPTTTATEGTQLALTATAAQPLNTSEVSTMMTEELKSTDNIIIGAVVGTFTGSLLVLIFLVSLVLLWFLRKHNLEKQAHQLRQPEREGEVSSSDREDRPATPEYVEFDSDTALEMKSNAAYASTALQISTEENVAYVSTKSGHYEDYRIDYDYI